jgi:murein DD-endopeptidase MepM/ murein hydrolase activator NlpD
MSDFKSISGASMSDREEQIRQYMYANPTNSLSKQISRSEARGGKSVQNIAKLVTGMNMIRLEGAKQSNELLLKDIEKLLTGEISGSGTPPYTTGTAGTQAQDIRFLANSINFECQAKDWGDLLYTATTQPGYIDERITKMLVQIVKAGYTLYVVSFNAGHYLNTNGSDTPGAGNPSIHSYGCAVDIRRVNGMEIQSCGTDSEAFGLVVWTLTELQGNLVPKRVLSRTSWGDEPKKAAEAAGKYNGAEWAGVDIENNLIHIEYTPPAGKEPWSGQSQKKSTDSSKRATIEALSSISDTSNNSGSSTTPGAPPITLGMCFPVPTSAVTEYSDSWGAPRVGHTHQGCDIMAPMGTEAYAVANGTIHIQEQGWQPGGANAGNYFRLTVEGGSTFFYYMHMQDITATEGQEVKAGSLVGHVGNTGNAYDGGTGAPHIHFEFHPNGGGATNPWLLLRYLYAQDEIGIEEQMAG